MSNPFGLNHSFANPCHPEPKTSYVVLQQPLHRVLNFTGHTIDDVVNDPIVKHQVIGFYKLHNLVQRRREIVDLELQWNPAA